MRVDSIMPECKRLAGAFLLLVAIGLSIRSSYILNFSLPYGKGNQYSYVHTHQGMMELLDQIEAEVRTHGKRNILIATHHYWPLPYYLRDHEGNTGYMKTDEPDKQSENYDVLIISSKSKWEPTKGEWVKKYYRLSDCLGIMYR